MEDGGDMGSLLQKCPFKLAAQGKEGPAGAIGQIGTPMDMRSWPGCGLGIKGQILRTPRCQAWQLGRGPVVWPVDAMYNLAVQHVSTAQLQLLPCVTLTDPGTDEKGDLADPVNRCSEAAKT
eukprot:s5988_g2.t1